MTKPPFLFGASSTLILSLLIGCGRQAAPPAAPLRPTGPPTVSLTADQLESAGIRSGRAEVASWVAAVSATGNLNYDADRVSAVSARVPGRVVEIRTDLGQGVSKGQILCLIDSPEAGEAQAAFLKALSELNVKQKSYDRARMLEEAQAISQGELIERQAAYEAARSDLSLAENRLHLLGFDQQQVDLLRRDGDREVRALFPLRAPLAGRVVERQAWPGTVVEGTTELFKVADITKLWLDLHLPEKEVVQVRKGQSVSVSVAAYPGERFAGVLDYVGDVVEPESRMVLARVILPNAEWKLKPGMFAEAEVEVVTGRKAVVLPEASVQTLDGAPVVFLAKGGGLFEARPVKLGAKSGERVEVLEGVRAGDEVATRGALTLKAEVLKSSFGEE